MEKQFGYELEFFGANLNYLAEKYGLLFYEKYVRVPYTFYHVKDVIFQRKFYIKKN